MKSNHPTAGRPLNEREPATGQIQLRVTLARKNAYVRAARPGKLTAWIFEKLDCAAGYDPAKIERSVLRPPPSDL